MADVPNRSQKAAQAKQTKKNDPFPHTKSRKRGHARQRAPYHIGSKIIHDRTMRSSLLQEVLDTGRASACFGVHPDLPQQQADRTTRGEGKATKRAALAPPAAWPVTVTHVPSSITPEAIEFPDLGDLCVCSCKHHCAWLRCENAASSVFCHSFSCEAGEDCGNRPKERSDLELFETSMGLHLRFTASISAGSIVCSYVGQPTLATSGAAGQQRQYAMKLRTRAKTKKAVYIDAEHVGGYGRFANHSCEPKCVFVELRCRDMVEVVLVAITKINASDEITVDYGDDLWFTCMCGSERCSPLIDTGTSR